MLALSPTVAYDVDKPLHEQAPEVTALLNQLVLTPPADVLDEACSPTLNRPVRQRWETGDAEVIRLTTYNHPATHAACFATCDVQVLVRPKVLL